MQKANLIKNNFAFRAVVCPKCKEKIIHPSDQQEYDRFDNLRNKEFHVKMRLVGNSYAVSIPKEIVSFMREQEKIMNDMVRLCFEDMGKLSLDFGKINQEKNNITPNTRIIKTREYKIIKNNKPALHIKEFSDSTNPENKRTQIIKNKFEDKEEQNE